MPNIFNADNGVVSGSAGIKLSSDTSGVLNIQTNGTTAISISASQVVSFPATSGFSFAGQVTFAAGTAAAPSISVTGDTNTGIYFPAADTIAFAEGGVESARFDSSGNFGLGTASPSTMLHVERSSSSATGLIKYAGTAGSGQGTFAVQNSAGNGVTIGTVSTGWTAGSGLSPSESYIWTAGAHALSLGTNSAERARIDAAGRFLIGYTAAQETNTPLQIDGNGVGSTLYVARFANSSTSTSVYNVARWIQGAAGSAVGYVGTGGSTVGNAAFQNTFVVGTQSSNALVFNTNDTERARIDAVGNMGLGVTPDTWGGRVIQFANGVSYGTRTINSAAMITQNAILNGSDVWQYKATAAASAYQLAAGGHYWSVAGSGTAGTTITAFNTIAMTLDASGNLGIGTSSPLDRLDVASGNVNLRARVRNTTGSEALILFQNSDTGTTLNDGLLVGIGADETGYLYHYENQPIVFGTNNTERARITSAGRLGVGTSSPSYNFQVQKTSLAAPAMMIGGAFFGGPRLQVYGLDADANAWMGLGTDMAGNPYEHSIYFPDVGGNGILTFGTYNGTTYTTRMSLTRTGNLNVTGALSKGSGSFRIPHPLKEETHDLVHSFIEGPQADLIYSGKVQLEGGVATVNIDAASGMTEGTFVVLCRDIRCFTNNETDWDNVRGKVVGNLLTIECQNPDSDAVISWMVIGERQDKHMYDTDWTDADGKVIVEPLKPVIKKGYN